jgi:HSP20 family molecular chaperone IbpA
VKRAPAMRNASTTFNKSNEERLNNFQQEPKQLVFYQRTPFNIEQDDQHVTLSIDVPGYSVSDLNITVNQDGTLTVAGKRKNKIGDAFAFQRQFALSPTTMDTTTVTANVVDSLLIIAITKKEIPKPRLIVIATTTKAQDTDRQETEGPSEEEQVLLKEESILFEKAPPVGEKKKDLVTSGKKPITVEIVNDEDEI